MREIDDALARRLNRALDDLGLGVLSPRVWRSEGDRRVSFDALDPRSADRLACTLEDLADRVPPATPPVPVAGQLSFELSERRRLELRLVKT